MGAAVERAKRFYVNDWVSKWWWCPALRRYATGQDNKWGLKGRGVADLHRINQSSLPFSKWCEGLGCSCKWKRHRCPISHIWQSSQLPSPSFFLPLLLKMCVTHWGNTGTKHNEQFFKNWNGNQDVGLSGAGVCVRVCRRERALKASFVLRSSRLETARGFRQTMQSYTPPYEAETSTKVPTFIGT